MRLHTGFNRRSFLIIVAILILGATITFLYFHYLSPRALQLQTTPYQLPDPVASLAVSPDGTYLAVADDAFEESRIRCWNFKNGRDEPPFQGAGSPLFALACSPDSRFLAGGSDDGYLIIWKIATKEVYWKIQLHNTMIYDLVFSPTESTIVTSGHDAKIVICDYLRKQVIKVKEWEASVSSLAFTNDGSRLAFVVYPSSIYILTIKTQETGFLFSAGSCEVRSLVFASMDRVLIAGTNSGQVLFWSCGEKRIVATGETRSGSVNDLAVSKNHKWIALGCGGPGFFGHPPGHIEIWDLSSYEFVSRQKAHTKWVTQVVWSSDGQQLVSGGFEGEVHLWTSLLTRKTP